MTGVLLFFSLGALLLGSNGQWTDNNVLKQSVKDRKWTPVPKFSLNMDLPAKQRWTDIGARYKDKAPFLIDYLRTMIPAWAIPIVETIGNDIEPYFKDYGDEMIGLAEAMGLKVGDIVVLNLVYQLESIGLNCSNWNNTGPTIPNDPGCMVIDPKQEWCYCKDADADGILRAPVKRDVPGLCTSVVAEDQQGQIWHGRNLDWNLPDVLLEMAVDVDYQKGGKTIFTGSTIVGFVGILNAIKVDGEDLFSVSINARNKGGKILGNLLEALMYRNALTPSQHLRRTFETIRTFSDAVDSLSTGHLVNEVYYTMAGAAPGEGVVISRDRNEGSVYNQTADQWFLDPKSDDGWFRLQTNYDHWNPVPKADDRRNPGIEAMQQMTQAQLNEDNLRNVMETWPVFNHHTDVTGIFNPARGMYVIGVWLEDPK